jgi:predicted phosphoribosyltransferase
VDKSSNVGAVELERIIAPWKSPGPVFADLHDMRTITLALPRFGFIVATRAALGVGIGLLVASRLSAQQRRAAGVGLIALGAATTIPAARWLSRAIRRESLSPVASDSRLIGATRYARKGDDEF